MSLLSKTTLDQAVRSCAFNPDGSQIGVGMTDGSFMVLRTKYVDLKKNIYIWIMKTQRKITC